MRNPAAIPPKTRRHLSFDPLIRQIRRRAKQLPETRNGNGCSYSVADTVMSASALFTLKDPSLLAFQERRNDVNMKNIFRILQVPSDTQMREILDSLEPDALRPMFNDVLRELQRGKTLEDRKRNVQHAQESGLSVRPQPWSWPAEPVDDFRAAAADVGILGRPNAGTLLSLVSSGSPEANHSAIVVGSPAFALPSFRVHIDAAATRSDAVRLGEGVARVHLDLPPPRQSSLSRLAHIFALHLAWLAITLVWPSAPTW